MEVLLLSEKKFISTLTPTTQWHRLPHDSHNAGGSHWGHPSPYIGVHFRSFDQLIASCYLLIDFFYSDEKVVEICANAISQ